ncbi:MAG: ABC transporter permease, partial [Anaerolineales bacterium]|jgi:putative ABC transport system permease protein
MKPRWRKVFLDLFENKGRTLLVVLSIAVGVFSIGVIAGTYVIISNDMSVTYAANNPANIEFRMDDFDDDMLTTIRNTHGIEDAEGRRVVNMRVREMDREKWTTLDIIAVDDFDENKVNLLNLISGQIKPKKDEVILERDALDDLDIQVGQDLLFELPDGTTKSLKVVGIVLDPTTGADDFLAPPFGYVTMDTLPTLHQPELFNRVYATVSENQDDMDHIRAVGGNLKDRIEKVDYVVTRTRFSKTHEHPMASIINAVLGILLALGILIVFLSSSLIANTLSALLNQHMRHIGVIKLVGGRNRQVLGMYFVLILVFGFLALLIAVPLGGQGAYWLSEFIADKMGFSLLGYRIVPIAFVIQIVIGLLVPIVAGLAPVINGARVTVLRAISGDMTMDEKQTEESPTRESRWERFQTRVTNALARRGVHIPRPLLISLRNTFRRRGRLVLTLFTLTMGGAIFIAVFNVRVSLYDYMGSIGQYFRADVTVDFDEAYRLREVEQYLMQVDGVEFVEGWQYASVEALMPDDTVADNISLLAPPAESALVKPILVEGRWLRPDDVRSLTVSESILTEFPNLKAGDYLHLKVNGQEEDWQVVGIFKFIGQQGTIGYAPFEYISRMNNQSNRAYSYRVVTAGHDRAYQDKMADYLDNYLRDNGFKVRKSEAGLASLDKSLESLDILVTFLLIMALLTASVGSMGLTGTMSMNVLERTREIGIMRSIGAKDSVIMRTVIAEGMVIGLISFALAVILSIPFTYLLSTIISVTIFETPIKVVFTFMGYGIWIALVLVLSALASIVPAQNAARLTIREVLAYE